MMVAFCRNNSGNVYIYNQDPMMPMEDNYNDHPSNGMDSYATNNNQMAMKMYPPPEDDGAAAGRNHLSSFMEPDGSQK
jgi:hypothetical protein